MLESGTLKSKSFKAGVAGILGGIALCLTGNKAEGIQAIYAGIVTIFLRDAIAKTPAQ